MCERRARFEPPDHTRTVDAVTQWRDREALHLRTVIADTVTPSNDVAARSLLRGEAKSQLGKFPTSCPR